MEGEGWDQRWEQAVHVAMMQVARVLHGASGTHRPLLCLLYLVCLSHIFPAGGCAACRADYVEKDLTVNT